MAGEEGVGPSYTVLETVVLPLDDSPIDIKKLAGKKLKLVQDYTKEVKPKERRHLK